MVNCRKFGVDEATNKPFLCANMTCSNCKIKYLGKSCANFRTEWLEEEYDDWADFRDLKRGDIIMVSIRCQWYPVIFVRLDEFGLRYSKCIDNRGEFICAVEFEEDPRRVKKCLRREYYEQ